MSRKVKLREARERATAALNQPGPGPRISLAGKTVQAPVPRGAVRLYDLSGAWLQGPPEPLPRPDWAGVRDQSDPSGLMP